MIYNGGTMEKISDILTGNKNEKELWDQYKEDPEKLRAEMAKLYDQREHIQV